jgi:hypothetical protein
MTSLDKPGQQLKIEREKSVAAVAQFKGLRMSNDQLTKEKEALQQRVETQRVESMMPFPP